MIDKNQIKDIETLSQSLLNRNHFCFLVGSGISASSGVPTGGEIVCELSKEIYLSENIKTEKDEGNNSVYSKEYLNLIERQKWYDSSQSPYSNLLQRRYPTTISRTNYFRRLISGRRNNSSHINLSRILSNADLNANICLTTNFDPFIEYSLIEETGNFPFVSYHDDDFNTNVVNINKPLVLKLHGDFLYGNIVNLDKEIQMKITKQMRTKISSSTKQRGMVIIGYGGNDVSVMNILTELAPNSEHFVYGVYWIKRKNSEISTLVNDFLKSIKSIVCVLEVDNSDDFLSKLVRNCKCTKKPIKTKSQNYIILKSSILQNFRSELDTSNYITPTLSKYKDSATDNKPVTVINIEYLIKKLQSEKEPVFLKGPGGRGKTQLMKYIVIKMCQKSDIIPVFIDLTLLNSSISNYLENAYKDSNLREHVSTGKTVFCFDSLGQSIKYKEHLKEILSISSDLVSMNNIVIIASRKYEMNMLTGFNDIYDIMPFSESQVLELCKKTLTNSNLLRIKSIIENDSSIRKLLEDPLLISLTLSIINQFTDIPRNRNEIFDRYLLLGLGSRKSITSKFGGPSNLLDILAELAYYIFFRKSAVDKTKLLSFLREKSFQGDIGISEEYASNIFKELIELNILLLNANQVTFYHNEFRFYAISIWIRDNWSIREVIQEIKRKQSVHGYLYYLSGFLDDSSEIAKEVIEIDYDECARIIGNAKYSSEEAYKMILSYSKKFGHTYEFEMAMKYLAQNSSEYAILYLENMAKDICGTDRTKAMAANILGYIPSEEALNALIRLNNDKDKMTRARSIVGFRNHIYTYGLESIENNDKVIVKIIASLYDSSDVRFHSSFVLEVLRKELDIKKEDISTHNFYLYAFDRETKDWIKKCKSVNREVVLSAIKRIRDLTIGFDNGGDWKFRSMCVVSLLEIYKLFPEEIVRAFAHFIVHGHDDFFILKIIEFIKGMNTNIVVSSIIEEAKKINEKKVREYSIHSVSLALGMLEHKKGIECLMSLLRYDECMVHGQLFDSLKRLAIFYPDEVKQSIFNNIQFYKGNKLIALNDILSTIESWSKGQCNKPTVQDLRNEDAEMHAVNSFMWSLRTGVGFEEEKDSSK